MANKKGFNDYKIDGEKAIIYINNRNSELVGEALVDTEEIPKLIKAGFHWFQKNEKGTIPYYIWATERYTGADGYRKGRDVILPRYILEISDPKIRVDHINHDGRDNRKVNLRLSNASTNARNRAAPNKNNKSGYRNVCMINGKWNVQLMIDGKNTCLGNFHDINEAAKFAEEMRKKYYGEFAGNG